MEVNDIDRASYISLIQKIERQGLESIESDLLHRLMLSFDEERKARSVQNSDRKRALMAQRQRKIQESLARTKAHEKIARDEHTKIQIERTRRMEDWFRKLISRDKMRAEEKSALRELISSHSRKEHTPHESKDQASQPKAPSVHLLSNVPCQDSTSSPLTARSTQELFNLLSYRYRKRPNSSGTKFLAPMAYSNYLESTKQASAVYCQTFSHRRDS